MPGQTNIEAELKAATDRILASKSPKKLIVAGPGAGKTYIFKELLKADGGAQKDRLVLTFINTLKGDLVRNLGEMSQVYTLHGYCQSLLRRDRNLRSGLSENFRCYPGLRYLIPEDWAIFRQSPAPPFIKNMRALTSTEDERNFYFDRTNFYDAVDFDDSVYRTSIKLSADKTRIPKYTLTLVDEFQDFNKMEASIIDLIADQSPIVVAGDDDQALYSEFRDASSDHIRVHHAGGKFEVFELPFCMRCPEVIVAAVGDVLKKAKEIGRLNGRIEKAYRYFAPKKGADSAKFPCIKRVEMSAQGTGKANYFGRYIEQYIKQIPQADIEEAAKNNEPAVLIIASDPYRRQVTEHLISSELLKQIDNVELTDREKGLQILGQDEKSNLGWRILLGCGQKRILREALQSATQKKCRLFDVVPTEQRDSILAEAKKWVLEHQPVELDKELEETAQTVAITTYEGSKGRSAQYVFLVGLHSTELPKNVAKIEDIEICRFLVGLTRTKKECSILTTRWLWGNQKKQSEFIGWIDSARFEKKVVNADYWKS